MTMEQRLSGADSSLNAPIAVESESEAQDFIADTRPTPEQATMDMHDSAVLSKWLNEALTELSSRERLIIMKRRLQEEGATLEQLGGVLGVSKERVRQLESRAMKKLKKSIESQTILPMDLISDFD